MGHSLLALCVCLWPLGFAFLDQTLLFHFFGLEVVDFKLQGGLHFVALVLHCIVALCVGLGPWHFAIWLLVCCWDLESGQWTLEFGFWTKRWPFHLGRLCWSCIVLPWHSQVFIILPFGVAFGFEHQHFQVHGVFGVHLWFGGCAFLLCCKFLCLILQPFGTLFVYHSPRRSPWRLSQSHGRVPHFCALQPPLLSETQKLGLFNLDDENKEEKEEGKSFWAATASLEAFQVAFAEQLTCSMCCTLCNELVGMVKKSMCAYMLLFWVFPNSFLVQQFALPKMFGCVWLVCATWFGWHSEFLRGDWESNLVLPKRTTRRSQANFAN